VMDFQRAAGLRVTGSVNAETWNRIIAQPPVPADAPSDMSPAGEPNASSAADSDASSVGAAVSPPTVSPTEQLVAGRSYFAAYAPDRSDPADRIGRADMADVICSVL